MYLNVLMVFSFITAFNLHHQQITLNIRGWEIKGYSCKLILNCLKVIKLDFVHK